jgi:hypothetical protein
VKHLVFVCALLLAACGSGSDDPDGGGGEIDGSADAGGCPVTPAGDPATVPLRGACPLEDRLGGFKIVENGDYTAISGEISDGVVPQSVLEEVASDGDCRLLRRNNPFCSPGCDGTETCREDGVCIPFPRQQDVGTVSVQGLAACSAMTARQPGNSYYETELPHPGFAAGDLVRLTTLAGDFGPLELHGVGIAPLAAEDPDLAVVAGEPLPVTWNAAPEGARSRILLSLNIDQHGVTPVTLVCDFPDTGSATISASMIDQLFGGGVSGFPNARIVRHTTDSQAVGDGCVELIVASERLVNVTTD